MTMNAVQWILHVMREHADRTFLVDAATGRETTFGDLHDRALAVGAFLRGRGLRRGDRAACLLHNSVEFAAFYFGCLYAGVTTVPVNPALSRAEAGHILAQSRARLAVASASTLDLLAGERPASLREVLVLPVDGPPPPDAAILDVAALPVDAGFVPLEGVLPADALTIVFTSGTTAQPKGVVHRIADLVDNARLFNGFMGVGPENRFYGVLAMTYLGGYYNLLLLPFAAGASVVLAKTFSAATALDFWGPAARHGVNTLWLVPTIMAVVLEMDRDRKGEEFCRRSVRLALVGTAPLPARLRREFEGRYGLRLRENYALSETLFLSSESPAAPSREGASGRVLPGVQVTVLDEAGQPLPLGETGEVVVSTPFLMEGYLDAEGTGPTPIPPGAWFPTGDLGSLSATGDLFIVGRKKDLIIRGGVNVSPRRIEEAILACPDVVDAAVVGVPHRLYGEEIAAVVKLRQGARFEAVQADLAESLKVSLGQGSRPAYLVEIDDLPRTPTGKVRKNELRALLTARLGVQAEPAPPAPAAPAPVGGWVRRTIRRPDKALTAELARYPTSIVSDCLGRLGALDGRIHPLVRGRPFCGPAVTVEEVEGGNLMSHIALELLEPGDALVIDGKGIATRASLGGLQTLMAEERGAAGLVVHGMVRDLQDIVAGRLPVYALGASPAGPLKGWGGRVNYPVACGGVVVEPGDLVLGDDDGVVAVPRDLAGRVVEACARRLALEKDWFERVRGGESTLDVVRLRDTVEKLGIIFD